MLRTKGRDLLLAPPQDYGYQEALFIANPLSAWQLSG